MVPSSATLYGATGQSTKFLRTQQCCIGCAARVHICVGCIKLTKHMYMPVIRTMFTIKMSGSLLHLLSPVEHSSLSSRRKRLAAARNDVLCLIGKLCLKQVHTVLIHHKRIVLRTIDTILYGMLNTLHQE
jgi:hypothetical protein